MGLADDGERIEGVLGPQLLDDADGGVGDDEEAERAVHPRAGGHDQHEEHSQQGVDAREDVGADDVEGGAARPRGKRVDLALLDALGDFAAGEALHPWGLLHIGEALCTSHGDKPTNAGRRFISRADAGGATSPRSPGPSAPKCPPCTARRRTESLPASPAPSLAAICERCPCACGEPRRSRIRRSTRPRPRPTSIRTCPAAAATGRSSLSRTTA